MRFKRTIDGRCSYRIVETSRWSQDQRVKAVIGGPRRSEKSRGRIERGPGAAGRARKTGSVVSGAFSAFSRWTLLTERASLAHPTQHTHTRARAHMHTRARYLTLHRKARK